MTEELDVALTYDFPQPALQFRTAPVRAARA